MAIPPRSNVSAPIQVFVNIPVVDLLDALNAVINDTNKYLANFAHGIPQNVATVANLPPGLPNGTTYFASNGRKIGEGSGAGTGVQVYFSEGAWRVVSTDAPVLA